MDLAQALLFSPLILVVAFLYSSVGHGGASGYLAVMSFASLAPREMSTTALLLNLLVAGLAAFTYWRAGHLVPRLLWPFTVASVPAAFVGGLLEVPKGAYAAALAVVLLLAAGRLSLAPLAARGPQRRVSLALALVVGAAIGLLSGIVGVGGGIFLSPLMLLLRWADVKQTAAVSAAFIVANSASGLLGRMLGGTLGAGPVVFLVGPALLGGLAGSLLGARWFSGLVLRRMLALVLVIAAAKLLLAVVGLAG
ncbi:MAG: sulfite exporter TauE/SafE family protein [Chloroflexi bacterium]|nr:sulfite exporter TauE/SafE family protein [Chloroflexota bacterium]